MKKKEIYQAPAVEVVELKVESALLTESLGTGGTGNDMGWDN